MTEKRPRQYAAEIQALPSREQRNNALKLVPEHLQALTKAHIVAAFARKLHRT